MVRFSRGFVRCSQMQTVRLGKQPVEPHHLDSRPSGDLAESFCMMLVDPARIFVQGKSRSFHAVVAARGQVAAHAVKRPVAVCLVAERELGALAFRVILGIGTPRRQCSVAKAVPLRPRLAEGNDGEIEVARQFSY